MNVDDVKYKIEVMQAYVEGRQIQFAMRYGEDWDHVSDKFNYLSVDTNLVVSLQK